MIWTKFLSRTKVLQDQSKRLKNKLIQFSFNHFHKSMIYLYQKRAFSKLLGKKLEAKER